MRYEQAKRKLQEQNLPPEEYEKEVIKLAKKWKV
jgi:hypothetical protein